MAAEEAELLELHTPPKNELHVDAAVTEISRHSCKQLSYDEFFWNYMKPNLPVVLTGVSNAWECSQNWIQPISKEDNSTYGQNDNKTQNTAINFDYLKQKVGNCLVPVADCSTSYYNSHAKITMNFYDFLEYWQAKVNANVNSNTEDKTTANICNSKNLYLKDWHLKAQMPDYDFYQVPKHFASDWLNEQLVCTACDDYRFVYMGPKDTWTPFHADVFGSYSWSTNISGCKKWIMLPPGEEFKLADRLGNLPFCIDGLLLLQKHVRFFELLQRENEAIFVPSGWYHQVWNLTDTISVNHNWFNACNLHQIWLNLSNNMRQVIAEIEDCRQMQNFDEHCQMMLRASFGINYLDFIETLEFISERRLQCSSDNGNITAANSSGMSSKFLLFDKYKMSETHIQYDLQSIRQVVEDMLQDSVICDSRAVLYRRCLRLLEELKGDV